MAIDDVNAPAIATELSEEARLKMEIIESLLESCDRQTYGQRLKDAAKKLGKSVRTVQRLVQKWEVEGLLALTVTERTDNGKHRISLAVARLYY